MAQKPKFVVVEFLGRYEREAVPKIWVKMVHNKLKSWWPPEDDRSKISNMIRDSVEPGPGWTRYDVKHIAGFSMSIPYLTFLRNLHVL